MKRAFGIVLCLASLLTSVFGSSSGLAAETARDEGPGQKSADLVRVLQDNEVTRILRDATARYRPRSAAFVDVSVVSVHDGMLREHQTVVVENGLFTAVGSVRDVRIPRGALRINGQGQFLAPGLTDMHVHSMVSNSQKLLNLANGVTTVREMDGFPYLLRERQAIRENRLLGPTMYVAGTILAAMPMEDYARVVTSPDEARAAVIEQKRDGYDFIKVHNVLPVELYRAVFEEARRQSIEVVGHIPHDVRLEEAIRQGQRTLEHMKGYYDDRTLKMTTEDYVGLTKDAEVWNCPTFYTRRTGIARSELERLIGSSDEMRYVPAAEKRRWLEQAREVPDAATETIYERSAAVFRELLAIRARFLTGTDSGGGYRNHVPGFALQHEIETMESLGMPAIDVLRSSTIEAAAAMRQVREFGSIDVGMRADCILASKNPLETVANLREKKGVMVRGIWMPPEAIAEILSSVATVYADDDRLVGDGYSAALRSAVRDAKRFDGGGFAALVGREAALVTLGDLLIAAKLPRDAVDVLRIAVKAFPDSAPAHAALGAAWLARGNTREAKASVERSLAIDPGNDRARRLLESPPLRTLPSFDPVGVYAFEVRMLVNGEFKAIPLRLEVTGSSGRYSGRMLSDAVPEFALEGVTAVGNRFWATAVRGQNRVAFRLVVSESTVTGSWSAEFGAGKVAGTRSGTPTRTAGMT